MPIFAPFERDVPDPEDEGAVAVGGTVTVTVGGAMTVGDTVTVGW
jgi:hypothetical protein